jgi:CRISPR-associated protein Cas5t
MKFIRLQIYQPQAHYRIPFTYQRRHTYPIPPYSTVIGFLCNLLGIDDQSTPLFKKIKKLKISIAGRFGAKITEYIWFRNLSKKSHVDRFGYVGNRSIAGHIEHIGGQSPVSIDVLDEVHLAIHLAHENDSVLAQIKSAVEEPSKRLEVLHLGRAEDWIVVENISNAHALSGLQPLRRDADYGHFFWIPDKMIASNGLSNGVSTCQEHEGLLYNLTTFWEIPDFKTTWNRHGQRQFEYMRTKLNDGLIAGQIILYDEEIKLPVFLADL